MGELIPIVFLAIPIVFILSNTFLKYQKLKHGVGAPSAQQSIKAVEELKERLHNLEVIVSDTTNIPQLEQLSKEELQAQIDTLAEEVRQLKTKN